MAEARSLKQREYNTNVIAHDCSIKASQCRDDRNSNTFKSEALRQDSNPSRIVQSRAHENIFFEKPLATTVTRASYQDSNPLNVDRATTRTIQTPHKSQDRVLGTRDTNTWKSNVFYDRNDQDAKVRQQNTFKSTVFACAQVNGANRKILGGESKGTDTLFGKDDVNYVPSSQNTKIARPQSAKLDYKQIDRKQQVAKEFHGENADALHDNKRDGALMASGVHWNNSNTRAIEAASPLKTQGLDSKALKHQNLQSSVFGGGYVDQEPIEVDRTQSKITYGTTAGWMNQAALAHPKNDLQRAIAYKLRQKELASQNINLEQTNVEEYMPEQKVKHTEVQDKVTDAPIPKGRKVNDDFKAGVNCMESHNQNYDSKQRAQAVLQGNYQKVYQPVLRPHTAEKQVCKTHVQGRETKATKQAMLASNDFISGVSSLQHYPSATQTPQVVDLVVSNLKEETQADNLKRISGSKHVISAVVDEDNMLGTCKGTGRIQIRLNNGETVEQVKLNFLREGIIVQDHSTDPRKKPNLTGIPREKSREMHNHKIEKQSFLQTQNPDMFGTTKRYKPLWK